MGEFKSDHHCIYYCGQQSLRRNKIPIIVNKWVWNALLGCDLKNDRMISVPFQGKLFNITVTQLYALISKAEEVEVEWFCAYLQDLLEVTPLKIVLFIIGDWNAKVGSQETPGGTGKFGLGVEKEARKGFIEFCQENTRVTANTPSNNTREDSTHGHHQMVNPKIRLVIFFAAKVGEASTQSSKTRMGADCCSDHELPMAKFRPKLKKVGKISRPFRYDLNQITYNYTGEVADRFKGLDLIMDRGSWQCTGGSDQDKLQEKEMQKVKMVVWRCLTNSC